MSLPVIKTERLYRQIANAIIKSNKYPECKERYRRIKSRRGHKKLSSPCAGCS